MFHDSCACLPLSVTQPRKRKITSTKSSILWLPRRPLLLHDIWSGLIMSKPVRSTSEYKTWVLQHYIIEWSNCLTMMSACTNKRGRSVLRPSCNITVAAAASQAMRLIFAYPIDSICTKNKHTIKGTYAVENPEWSRWVFTLDAGCSSMRQDF